MSIDGRTRSAAAAAGPKPRLHDEHNQRAVRLILDGLVPPPRLRASARPSCLYVLSSFQRTDRDPREAVGSRMLGAPHPAGPKAGESRFLGNLTSLVDHPGRVNHFFGNCPRFPRTTPTALARPPSHGDGIRRPDWSSFPCVLLGSPGAGLLGDERRKRKSIIRAEGGLVNPYRSSMLEDHLSALSGDPEPRRASTARCLTYGRPTSS